MRVADYTPNRLVLQSLPLTLWLIGPAIALFGLFSLSSLLTADVARLDRWFLAPSGLLLLVVGLFVIWASARVEMAAFDLERGEVTLRRYSLTGLTTVTCPIATIRGIELQASALPGLTTPRLSPTSAVATLAPRRIRCGARVVLVLDTGARLPLTSHGVMTLGGATRVADLLQAFLSLQPQPTA